MSIRNDAKALIIKNDKILLNRCIDETGNIYFDLPGGGQHPYESIEAAVIREAWEETGYRVRVIRFAALLEEIYNDRRLRKEYPDYTHRILHVFIAEPIDVDPQISVEKDYQQQGCEWVSVLEADRQEIRPANLKGKLKEIIHGAMPLYLGCEYI